VGPEFIEHDSIGRTSVATKDESSSWSAQHSAASNDAPISSGDLYGNPNLAYINA
jgi:hypothetical protein